MAPRLLYGTAWKAERTAELVGKALQLGFRAIDTACQPLHYNERGVGQALQHAAVARHELFVQTKFSPLQSKDTCPFDTTLAWSEQVAKSMEISLGNLGTGYVDSLLLHVPLQSLEETLQVWRAMEAQVASGSAKQLGVSNLYSLDMLRALYSEATVKPKVVQNRFYSNANFDKKIRAFCLQHGMEYQSFWTLTANPYILESGNVKQMAFGLGVTPEQVLFRFLTQEGVSPLTGTTQEAHMRQDLDIFTFELSESQRKQLRQLLDLFAGLV